MTAAGRRSPSHNNIGLHPSLGLLHPFEDASDHHRDQHAEIQSSYCSSGSGGGEFRQQKALATRKGFNQDQIAKLQDACGVCNAQQILSIWAVVRASRGKSFDT